MSTDLNFIEYVRDQLVDTGDVTFKKMFGEYALYVNTKIVAFACDNQLFVKPTDSGRARLAQLGEVVEAAPYPGAKLYFLIGDELEDREAIAKIIRATADALPLQKPKKPKSG